MLNLSEQKESARQTNGRKSFQTKKAVCARRCEALEQDLEIKWGSQSWHNGCEREKGKIKKSYAEYFKEFEYFPESKEEILKDSE